MTDRERVEAALDALTEAGDFAALLGSAIVQMFGPGGDGIGVAFLDGALQRTVVACEAARAALSTGERSG